MSYPPGERIFRLRRRLRWWHAAYAFAAVYGVVMAYHLVPEIYAEGARSRAAAVAMRQEINETWVAHRDNACQLVNAEERPFTTMVGGKVPTTHWRPVRVWRCGSELFDEIDGKVPRKWRDRIRGKDVT